MLPGAPDKRRKPEEENSPDVHGHSLHVILKHLKSWKDSKLETLAQALQPITEGIKVPIVASSQRNGSGVALVVIMYIFWINFHKSQNQAIFFTLYFFIK
jgi:hypothetical protein